MRSAAIASPIHSQSSPFTPPGATMTYIRVVQGASRKPRNGIQNDEKVTSKRSESQQPPDDDGGSGTEEQQDHEHAHVANPSPTSTGRRRRGETRPARSGCVGLVDRRPAACRRPGGRHRPRRMRFTVHPLGCRRWPEWVTPGTPSVIARLLSATSGRYDGALTRASDPIGEVEGDRRETCRRTSDDYESLTIEAACCCCAGRAGSRSPARRPGVPSTTSIGCPGERAGRCWSTWQRRSRSPATPEACSAQPSRRVAGSRCSAVRRSIG